MAQFRGYRGVPYGRYPYGRYPYGGFAPYGGFPYGGGCPYSGSPYGGFPYGRFSLSNQEQQCYMTPQGPVCPLQGDDQNSDNY